MMILKKQREYLNKNTKMIGEKITPQEVKNYFGGDLGDLLNAELNSSSRKGAAIGSIIYGHMCYIALNPILPHVDVNSNPEILPELGRLALTASMYVNPMFIPALSMYVMAGSVWGTIIGGIISINDTKKEVSKL